MDRIPLHTPEQPRSFSRYLYVFGDLVFLAGVLSVSWAVHPSLYHPYQAPKFLLLGFFGILLFPAISLVIILDKKNRISSPFLFFLSGWALTNLLSGALARFQDYAFRQSAFFLACAIFAFWAFLRAQDRKLFVLTVGALAIVSLCGAFYGFTQFSGRDFLALEESGVPVAFWGNPNFASHFLIAVIPLFLAMIAAGPLRILFLVSSCLVFLQIVLLKSRGGFLGVTAGIIFFSWMMFVLSYKGKNKDDFRLVRFTPAVTAILIIGILVTGATFLYLDQGRIAGEISSVFSLSPESNQYRLISWKASIRLAFHHILLGVGPGHYRIFFPSYAGPEFWKFLGTFSDVLNIRAHNDYINILCETGLVGLGFFMGMLFYLFRIYRGLLKSQKVSHWDKIYASGLAAGLVSTLTQSMVDFNLYNPASGLVFWISGGFLAGFAAIRKPSPEEHASRITGSILLALSLTLLILVPHRLVTHYRTEKDLRNADLLFTRGEFEKAAVIASRVLDRNPHDLDAVTLYADSLRNIRGKEEEAVRAYQYWAGIEPWLVPIYNRMGDCWFRLGNREEAIKSFEKALTINPFSEPILLNLGNMALAERDFPRAVSCFERAASLGGDLIKESQAQYGIALMQLKRYREAIPRLEQGILRQQDKAAYLSELLGDCYLAIGDRENARIYYTAALMFGSKEPLKKKLSDLKR
jgi:O-antigen ligase/Flp pilus assembly protein TadD